jgi:hypothetical protein
MSNEVFQDYAVYPVKVMAFAVIRPGCEIVLHLRVHDNLNPEGYVKLLEDHEIVETLERKYGKGGFGWHNLDDSNIYWQQRICAMGTGHRHIGIKGYREDGTINSYGVAESPGC